MKTLHLTNAYHGTSGGIRTFYHALLDAANRERREVVLVVPGAEESVRDVGRFGRIHTLRASRAPVFDRRYRVMLPTQYMPRVGRISSILARERADLVEICDKYSLPYLAAMLRKGWHANVPRPTLVGLSCERVDDNMAAYVSSWRSARALTRWYVRHVYGPPFDYHVANSAYTAAELKAALHDRAADFINVCPMGVDVQGFGPERRSTLMRDRLIRRTGGDAASTLLFYAGRLSPEKNLGLLIETLRLLAADPDRDFRLVIAGDGPLAPWVRDQATQIPGERIALCGNLDRFALAECCASCDVFVHPNPREPFGIGPLEAMASGVPVVVPAAGGVLEYANDGNAWVANPDPESFAAAVRSAARGGSARVAAARATASAFSWANITKRYFALYDELHDRRLHARRGSTSAPPLSSSDSVCVTH